MNQLTYLEKKKKKYYLLAKIGTYVRENNHTNCLMSIPIPIHKYIRSILL